MMRRSSNFMSIFKERKGWRKTFRRLFPAVSLFLIVLFIWSVALANRSKEVFARISKEMRRGSHRNTQRCNVCGGHCRPPGSEKLPRGIVAKTSNLGKRPLWGYPEKINGSQSLFAAAVGIKQKRNVNKIVEKFLDSNCVVMLFHYDGIVDEWKRFDWSGSVIHVSADNQTKWWFAKRFLHPDIVHDYQYIFLWDEDLGVENFHPRRYISIVNDEGFDISQPALDIGLSEVHHLITARWSSATVHRRAYKLDGRGIQCTDNSSSPPCAGWIELMAPVFSKVAWRCVWYMIQNDLIHAWGLDFRLGYCAQGDRTKTIGIVDAEYLVHYGLPTLGRPEKKAVIASSPNAVNPRLQVRRQSYNEYKVFRRRWKRAADGDKCWTNPYPDDKLQNTSLGPLT